MTISIADKRAFTVDVLCKYLALCITVFAHSCNMASLATQLLERLMHFLVAGLLACTDLVAHDIVAYRCQLYV